MIWSQPAPSVRRDRRQPADRHHHHQYQRSKPRKVLLEIHQRQLAKAAGINPATLSRMENSGKKVVRGQGRSIQSVLDALAKAGVEVHEDGVRIIEKKPRR